MTIGRDRHLTPAGHRVPHAIAILILLALAPRLGAQEPAAILSSGSYTEAEREEVLAVFAQAAELGVPVELMVPRLQEGIAKRVRAAQMVRALDRDLATLQEARVIMVEVDGAEPIYDDAGSWARGANLLAAGEPPEVLLALTRFSVPRPEAFRQATLLYLAVVQWGVVPELSLELARVTVLSVIEPDDFPAVAELFAAGQRNRLLPEEVVERVRDALSRGATLGELRRLFRR